MVFSVSLREALESLVLPTLLARIGREAPQVRVTSHRLASNEADVAAPAPQPATSTSGLICIEFPGGVRVSVDGSVDAGALARVLSVLR